MPDWQQLRALVEEGAARAPEDRAAYLAKACGDDEALRREVESLITASLRDEDYLSPPVLSPTAETVLALDATVGAYRLVRALGSGGMGTVYEAERQAPQRRVALKVMRAGLSSAASKARFQYEVEVLAGLQHPNIATMFDTGVHVEASNGRRELPWFAMEYVEHAKPIGQYAREKALSIDARVALFAEVCDAVHHGHARGVLHRDLKPDNILVGSRGVPKIIDFGVARATDADLTRATQRTRLGEVVGTLAYMSPEQIAGDRAALDVRSDVYALGVVLYELLTGRHPYDLEGANLVEAARRIREVEPRRLRAMASKVPEDVETIVLKCLAKDPQRRFDSAAALAKDLRRYLAREPVEAHPPSLAYQVRMFARRHRALVGAGALVLVASVAAAAISLLSLDHARRSERTAQDEAVKTRKLFSTLLDRSLATTREFAPRLKNLASGADVTLDMVKADLADLEALAALAPANPEVRVQIAHAFLQLGEVRGDPTSANQLGDREGCRASYEEALRLTEALMVDHPDRDDVRRVHGLALTRAGKLASFSRDHTTAEARLTRALEIRDALRTHHRDRWQDADAYVLTLGRMAELQADREDPSSAAFREKQLALAREMATRWPDPPEVRWRLASVLTQRASQHLWDEAYEAAVAHYDEALALLEPLAEAHPETTLYRLEYADALMHAGGLRRHMGDLEQATAQTDAALATYAALRERDADNRTLTMMLGMAHKEVGAVAQARAVRDGLDDAERRRHWQVARDAFKRAVDVYLEMNGGKAGGMVRYMRRYHDKACEALEALE